MSPHRALRCGGPGREFAALRGLLGTVLRLLFCPFPEHWPTAGAWKGGGRGRACPGGPTVRGSRAQERPKVTHKGGKCKYLADDWFPKRTKNFSLRGNF